MRLGILHFPFSILVFVSFALSAFADDPPTQWVDAATGHRITRLSREPGSSSFYFHQNGYPAGGDTLVISTPSGLSAINLDTGEIRQVVEARAGQVVVGRKSRQLYYLRGQGVFTTNIDTRETRKIGELPFRSDSGLTVNADETLLAGSCQDASEQAAKSTLSDAERASLEREGRLGARLARQLPMMLYTINTKTGEVKTFNHCTDWLNHVQFSPTDPGLLMFAHEGPWHRVDRPWVIRTDGTGLRLVHVRSMPMEISGHEFWRAAS
jgi:oligogalacturonide lyase